MDTTIKDDDTLQGFNDEQPNHAYLSVTGTGTTGY
ncbi:Os01g0911550 [Oryza sativa Japonica Group]|uniref:Os01g0911550 protein n=1 Tax=Oryza sativa subsp. japonica TaxID=39947 RepID=C7IWT0_ORYSJ|nr:Os01g0911550 [Oryza sativa Japonica Group]|eukprot:NP_001172706.1 Os01g0911550 [Oryza sativa Japonica Group]